MYVQFKEFPTWIRIDVVKIEHGFVWMRWCDDLTHDLYNGDLSTDEWAAFHKATKHAFSDLEDRTVILNANMIEYMR